MLKEFKEFAMRGNVVDMAVGIIIGAAFGKIVSSLVADIIMPPIGVLLGDVDFTEIYVNLSGGTYESLAAAQEAGRHEGRQSCGSKSCPFHDLTLHVQPTAPPGRWCANHNASRRRSRRWQVAHPATA